MPKGIYDRKKTKKKARKAGATRKAATKKRGPGRPPSSGKKKMGRPPGAKTKVKTAAPKKAQGRKRNGEESMLAKLIQQVVNALNGIGDAVREAGGLQPGPDEAQAIAAAELQASSPQAPAPQAEEGSGASDSAPVS